MKKFFTLLFVTSILFCACGIRRIYDVDSATELTGTITLNLETEVFNPRTINAEGLQSFKDVEKWNVTFTPAAGSENLHSVEKSVSLVDSSYSFSLLPGTYDVTFKGSVTVDEDSEYPYTLYYAGYTTVTVEVGENDPVTVYVGLQKEAGESSCLHYTVALGNDVSFSQSPKFKVLLENLSGGENFEFEEANVVREYVGSFSNSEFAFVPEGNQLEIFLANVPSAFYRMSIYYVTEETEYKFVLTDDLFEVSKGAWIFVPDAVSIGTLSSRTYYATENESSFNGLSPAYSANLTTLLTKLSQANDWHYARIIMQNIPDMGSESIQNICAGINNTVDITVKTEDEIYRIKNGAITFNLDYALDETEDGGVVEVSGTWPMSSGVRTVRNVTIKAPEGKTLTLERGASFVDKSMIEVPEGKTLTLENVVLDGKAVSVNTGSVSGGAVNVYGNLVMNNCVICNHRTGQNTGAALYVNADAIVEMTQTDMYNCVANNSPIYLKGNFTMNSGNIYGCGSGTTGGVFYINGGCLTMNGGLIGGEGTVQTISGERSRGNTATYGGAVYVSSEIEGTKFIMNDGTISYNSVSWYGGGVYIGTSSTIFVSMEFNGGTIAHNKLTGANGLGSGVYVGSALKLSESAIIGEDNDVYIKPNSDYVNLVVPYGQVETYRAAYDGSENIVEVACTVEDLPGELVKVADNAEEGLRYADNPVYIKILDTTPDLTELNAALKAKSGLHCDLNMRLCTGLTTFTGTSGSDQTAFEELRYLAGISLPSTITSIGDYAFYYCSALERISMPTGITSIGDRAFYFCSSLGSLDLPNVTSVGDSAFAYSSVTSVTFTNKLTSIANAAFDSAKSLTSIEIPEAITKLEYTFRGTTSLDTVIINGSSMDLAAEAFSGSNVKKIVFKGTSLTIGGGDAVFTGCSNVQLIAAKKSYLPDLSSNATLSGIIKVYGATDAPEAAGDVALADGTFASADAYLAMKEYFDIKLAGVVGQLSDDKTSGYIVGMEDVIYQTHPWAQSGTTGYSTNFTAIQGGFENGSGNGGDGDGSDNWAAICAEDPNAATHVESYPAFGYASSYGRTHELEGTAFEFGWYLPTVQEINVAIRPFVDSGLNDVLTKLGKATLEGEFLSSNQDAATNSECKFFDISSGATGSAGKSEAKQVCVIRKYNVAVSVANFSSLLSSLSTNTPDTPYTITITDETPTLSTLRDAIYRRAIYVDLDLSGCTGLTEIPSSAFNGATSPNTYSDRLVGIRLPSTITTIKYGAFYAIGGLKSIVIPAAVTSIADSVFYHCDGLKSVTFENPTGWMIQGQETMAAIGTAEENAQSFVDDKNPWCSAGLIRS